MSTFTAKRLRFTFSLANAAATFEGTNSNTFVVTGLRAAVHMNGSGFPAFPEARAVINGLKQDDMNALTALSFQMEGVTRNVFIVDADSGDGWSTVFAGEIVEAGPDYSNMPAVGFHILARVLFFFSINPAPVTAYTGATSVASIVSNIAARMGKAFENNGVTTVLDSPYLPGTLAEQLRSVCQQAGIDCYNDPAGNVIAITPKYQPRRVPRWVLSPAIGLVGYPKLESRGYIQARSVFNPAFRFGGPVRIEGSDLPRANGDWMIGVLSHTLESETPGGAWFSDSLCYPAGSLPPIR